MLLKARFLLVKKSTRDTQRNVLYYFSNKAEGNGKPYQIVLPGIVSEVKAVPGHIVKPGYVTSKLEKMSSRAPIKIHDAKEIDRMRETCSLARHILCFARSFIEPGITTDEIDCRVHEEIIRSGAYPSTLYYKGFPKSCCISVNNVVCHGIPDNTLLANGDIINIDVTVYYLGCHGDTSDTFPVGQINEAGRKLITTTQDALSKGINSCKPGARFSEIAHAIEPHAVQNGFEICKRFVGHGIGEEFHMPPNIFHGKSLFCDRRMMAPGMIFTIEPILMEGGNKVEVANDGWTVLSKDNLRSAQAEHTVLVTSSGVEVLT